MRFVNIYHEGWDAHSDVAGNHKNNCGKTDRASAALVIDLKRRGLLDDTLVIWGGEFGRTPMVETNPALGRSLGPRPPPAGLHDVDGRRRRQARPHLRRDRRPRLPRRRDNRSTSTTSRPPSCTCLGFDHEKLTTATRAATSASPTSTATSSAHCWRER